MDNLRCILEEELMAVCDGGKVGSEPKKESTVSLRALA